MAIIGFVLAAYVVGLFVLLNGWNKASRLGKSEGPLPAIYFSIVVPFRNESENLPKLFNALSNQSCTNFEVIAVDDHSTDGGVSQAFTDAKKNWTIIANEGTGKKSAISTGVHRAGGDVIVTTDADCIPSPDWLKLLQSRFENPETQMVIGPVIIRQNDTLFSRLQAVEFSSLIGVSVATCALGKPTMCNGANLAYRKSIFVEVNGYGGNSQIASGDDEFLMRKVSAAKPGSIRYLGHNGVVVTEPAKNPGQFLSQRLRWAAKWNFNTSWFTMLIAFSVIAVQASWLIALIGLWYMPSAWLILTTVMKIVAEFIFLRVVCKSLTVKWSTFAFLLLQLIYAPYVLTVALLSNFVPYSWKGRKIR